MTIRVKQINIISTPDSGDKIHIVAEYSGVEYEMESGFCRTCGEEFMMNNIKTAMNKLLRTIDYTDYTDY